MLTQENLHNFHQSELEPSQNAAAQATGEWIQTQEARREVKYAFYMHYHPCTDDMMEALNKNGLEGLLDVKFQELLSQPKPLTNYEPNYNVVSHFPNEKLDFDSKNGAYAVYNWELYFHAPLAVAVHLSKNQRFAEAQRWFHFIFDPTSNDPVTGPENPQQRFWKFKRFRDETKATLIDDILEELAKGSEGDSEMNDLTLKNISDWEKNPFSPHVVARGRVFSFQVNVVMKYLDNLIAWGDSLFRQDSMETLNEATQIYTLAANILGERPQKVPARGKITPKSFRDIKDNIDAFGNALVEMENSFPFNSMPASYQIQGRGGSNSLFGISKTVYFSIPNNEKLLEYWDKVDDRLYKIRHCMNIEGTVRQLALFEPPIDPGILVKAAAAGLNIGNIISSLNQPLSTVRSAVLIQKALEICGELKSLGQALLSSIEKQESEHLASLRQCHELKILELAQDVKFLQWKEAEANTESLLKSRAIAFERYKHYQRILGKPDTETDKFQTIDTSRIFINQESFDEVYANFVGRFAEEIIKESYVKESATGGLMEWAGRLSAETYDTMLDAVGGTARMGGALPLNKNESAALNVYLPSRDFFNFIAISSKAIAAILSVFPDIDLVVAPYGSGVAKTFGGNHLSNAAGWSAGVAKDIAGTFQSSAEDALRLGNFYRRAEEYVLQNNLAASELMQYGRQIIASLIREQITRIDYENHKKQIEQSLAVQDFMKEKFTNEELYSWMRGELSKIYFECYKFAFDIARKTEAVMKHELMRPEFDQQSFIKYGYWDGGRQGLLAGEALSLDLKRLEMAYHDYNRREYELTKHVSLKRLAPVELLNLKTTGSCEIGVPEWLFDLDCPGQFMRRIKNVSLSIPCVAGPYTGIHCKLSLVSSSIRISSSSSGGDYKRKTEEEDIRFRDYKGAIQSIVTSSAQDDSGLFETNLRDERFLPFEGAGVISKWRLELLNDINEVPTFDTNTISDVILLMRYTAREAGNLREEAIAAVITSIAQEHFTMFSIKHEFPQAWSSFINATGDQQKLSIAISQSQLPYWYNFQSFSDTSLPFFLYVTDLASKQLKIIPSGERKLAYADGKWSVDISSGDGDTALVNFLKGNSDKEIFIIFNAMSQNQE